jgi:hypothetical protein
LVIVIKCRGEDKVVRELNEAPHHEDVWGSESIFPCILNLGTRWRRVVSFTPRPRNPRVKSRCYLWIWGLVSPRAGEEKTLPLSGI